jgi:hypothetical protein
MLSSTVRSAHVAFFLTLLCWDSSASCGQAVDQPRFKALPRVISYATPLAPAGGAKAVIVYGKDAPWTKSAAAAVQKAVADWCGATLELADDRAVTADDTWLLADAYRQTPLIVLGNAEDNRVLHALGTRYLLQSNRSWPGGDRYYIRSVFEPFVSDVNYIVLEASNQAGGDAAAAKFAELLKGFSADAKAAATIPPRLRVQGGLKDKWSLYKYNPAWWQPQLPPEMFQDLNHSVSELALMYQGKPSRAGWGITRESNFPFVWSYVLGGDQYPRQGWSALDLDQGTQRAVAAMCLLGCRTVGGRAYPPMDHYGSATFLVWLRSIFQTGVLNENELNELESAITLSSCDPRDYVMNNIGSASGYVGGVWSGRHSGASMLTMIEELDYVLGHCRLDDRTRREVERRYDGLRKTVAAYIRSFRGNHDDSCLGEDTVLQLNSVLMMGFMDHVRSGTLRKSADMFIMTSDNIPNMRINDPLNSTCYAGLSGFSSGNGCHIRTWAGGSLVVAAAFYYDDPQCRWFVRNRNLSLGSEGGYHLPMHSAYDMVGKVEPPTRYLGVRALPFDERIYRALSNPETPGRWEMRLRLLPDLPSKAADRVSIRDGFDQQDAYMYLATSQDMRLDFPTQNNSIARYTDLGDIWLYANTYDGSTWSRSVVNCSNGGSFVPRAACQIDALANFGRKGESPHLPERPETQRGTGPLSPEVSIVASTEIDSGGADWTRTIVHWKGHYFAVLDRMLARQNDDYTFTCRWRSLPAAALENGVWTATAPGGNVLRIQSAEDLVQTSEAWPCDGAASPAILQQYKSGHLAEHQEMNYLNLLYVSGQQRPDEFETKKLGSRAMLVKGKTKEGPHLAMLGVCGNPPFTEIETDAAAYYITGSQLHLAGVRTLRAKVKGTPEDILWTERPVSALVDFQTGQAQIEVPGDRAVHGDCPDFRAPTGHHPGPDRAPMRSIGRRWSAMVGGGTKMGLSPWRDRTGVVQAKVARTWTTLPAGTQIVALAEADALPKLRELVDSLWRSCPAPTGKPPQVAVAGAPAFDVKPGDFALLKPLARLTECAVTPTPGYNGINHGGEIWSSTDRLEFLFTFSKPADIGCVRFVGSAAEAGGMARGPGDLKFTAVLSDDNFQKDVREVDAPAVAFEETPRMVAGHFCMTRYPTWRIDLNAKAKQIKIRPRATAKDRAALVLTDIEAYGSHRVDQLAAQAIAADIDGDGADELLVATSQKELAAYDAGGKRLWHHLYDGEIHDLAVADLDEDGKRQALCYLDTEKLHRVNGDGSERPVGDVNTVYTKGVNIFSIGAWGPDDPRKKEVVLWCGEPSAFKVLPDGTVQRVKAYAPQATLRLANVYPNEPEAMAVLSSFEFAILSARKDEAGNYVRLGSRPVTGSNSGNEATPAGTLKQFCKILVVDASGEKWLVGGVASGLNVYPLRTFAKDAKEDGWRYNTGGPCAAALAAQDIDGDGVPEVLFARQDGFVNVFRLRDGFQLARISVGQPIIGMTVLRGRDGKPRIVVGTTFGVQVFGKDLKKIGGLSLPAQAAAFAGPGGKDRDRVYVVGTDGSVNVLVLK